MQSRKVVTGCSLGLRLGDTLLRLGDTFSPPFSPGLRGCDTLLRLGDTLLRLGDTLLRLGDTLLRLGDTATHCNILEILRLAAVSFAKYMFYKHVLFLL